MHYVFSVRRNFIGWLLVKASNVIDFSFVFIAQVLAGGYLSKRLKQALLLFTSLN
jgi:hypothetical protein